jgi:hypothetical protein
MAPACHKAARGGGAEGPSWVSAVVSGGAREGGGEVGERRPGVGEGEGRGGRAWTGCGRGSGARRSRLLGGLDAGRWSADLSHEPCVEIPGELGVAGFVGGEAGVDGAQARVLGVARRGSAGEGGPGLVHAALDRVVEGGAGEVDRDRVFRRGLDLRADLAGEGAEQRGVVGLLAGGLVAAGDQLGRGRPTWRGGRRVR